MTRRMKWMLMLLAAFLVFDAVALTIVLTSWRSSQVAIIGGKVVSSGTALIGGPFTLTTTDGKTVTDQTFRGKWMAIYFGYTFCPDACPTALSNMSDALQKIENGTFGKCDRCGKPISEARLEAIPYAVSCIDCQSRAEGS